MDQGPQIDRSTLTRTYTFWWQPAELNFKNSIMQQILEEIKPQVYNICIYYKT